MLRSSAQRLGCGRNNYHVIARLSGSVFGGGEPEARPSSVYTYEGNVDFNVVLGNIDNGNGRDGHFVENLKSLE